MRVIPGILVVLAAATAVAGAAAFGIGGDPQRSLMSPVDFERAKSVIESRARAALALCRERKGRDLELCKAEARANERVQVAELEVQYLGTTAAAAKARVAHVVARYDVARAKCNGLRGEERISCLHSARAEKARSTAL